MTKVPFFKSNPAFLEPDQLIASFVVRHVDFELVMERLRENTGPSNQHMLILGARGMGKTSLVLRVAAEIERDSELSTRWFPIRFNEASYWVSSVAEFWLHALRHLGAQTGEKRWQDACCTLQKERDDQRLLDAALARLLDFADEAGKRLVLIVENLNMLLGEQISDDDGWTLRHTLLNEPRILLLATATTRFAQLEKAGKAFYDLFWIHELLPLETEECRRLWTSISGVVLKSRRIRPIEILTGGNPRLLAILASFASRGSLRDLVHELESWVDDHTSYFKANLEMLAPQERKVYTTLANLWSPSTAREIASAARMAQNQVSAIVVRLRQRGAVTERKVGRAKRYQLAERMYNIYYLMRQQSDRGARVRAVVEFMIHYYDRDEIARKMAAIADEACALSPDERSDHFHVYGEVLRRRPDLRRDTIRATRKDFFEQEDTLPGLKKLQSSLGSDDGEVGRKPREDLEELIAGLEQTTDDDELERKLATTLRVLFDHIESSPHENDALSSGSRTRLALPSLKPSRSNGWILLGAIRNLIGNRKQGAEAIREALRLEPNAERWMLLGLSADDPEEALAAYQNALDMDPGKIDALVAQISLLRRLGRHEELVSLQARLYQLEPKDRSDWVSRGDAFLELGIYDEAISSYREALSLQANDARTWSQLGSALHSSDSQSDEVETAYRRAVELAPDDYVYWGQLGSYLWQHKKDLAEGEKAIRRSIELEPELAFAWVELGRVLILRDLRDEAIGCFRRATELGPARHDAWHGLALVLEEKEPSESIRAYEEAIKTGPLCDLVWEGLAMFLHSRGATTERADSHERILEHLVKQFENDAEVLNSAAWAIYEVRWEAMYTAAERWAQRALELTPDESFIEHTLACILLALGRMDEAFDRARHLITVAGEEPEFVRDVVDFFARAAAFGFASESIDVIKDSGQSSALEPLVVALKIKAGHASNAPQEVAEIAKDILSQIDSFVRGPDEQNSDGISDSQ